jgi:hypothetical protein
VTCPRRTPVQHKAVAESVATTLPRREPYLLLNHRLARRIVKAHSEWLDEVEREPG